MAIRKDDRTQEQKETHKWLVCATDKFMSGWGEARNGASKCAWACETLQEARIVEEWVSNRNEMKYVNINHGKWYPKAAHVHVYVVDEGHPALNKMVIN